MYIPYTCILQREIEGRRECELYLSDSQSLASIRKVDRWHVEFSVYTLDSKFS